MSDRHPTRNPRYHNKTRHRFSIHHQAKQRLLLRALNEMDCSKETPEESRAIAEMITRLEALLSSRQFVRTLSSGIEERPAKPRKRCSYGTSQNDPHPALNVRA